MLVMMFVSVVVVVEGNIDWVIFFFVIFVVSVWVCLV